MELVKHFSRPRVGLEFEYTDIKYENNFPLFLQKEARAVIKAQFRRKLARHAWKIWIDVNVVFQKLEASAHEKPNLSELDLIFVEPWFRCDESHIVLQNRHELNASLDQCFNELQIRFDEWIRRGSGFVFVKVKSLRLIAAKYQPLSGGGSRADQCCSVTLLPKKFRNNAVHIIGSENRSNQCFLDCIRVACTLQRKRRSKNPRIVDMQGHNIVSQNQFDTRNLTFPTKIDQLRLFEARNPILYINVFALTHTKKPPFLYVLYHSKSCEQGKVIVDLLLFRNHFFLIRSLLLFLGRTKRFVCRSCLLVFTKKLTAENHKLHCDHAGRVYKVPDPSDVKVKFTRKATQMLKEWQVYIDIETCVKPEVQIKPNGKNRMVHRHEGLAVGAIRICTSNPIHNSDLFLSVGKTCIQDFLCWLDKQNMEMKIIMDEYTLSLQMTSRDWELYLKQDKCEICGTIFSLDTLKVRDHYHLSGKYRAALCNSCNLGVCKKTTKDVCVTSHYFGRFDSALVIRSMAKKARKDKSRFKVIQKGRNNNIVIFYKDWMFTDSYNFLSSSLSNLMRIRMSDEKPNGPPVFPLIYNSVGLDRKKYKLLCQKQIFPFQMLTGLEVLEQTELPDKASFYDPLKNEAISDNDYEHAHLVWKTFKCKTIQDYLVNVYLKVDVLALANIFEDFRQSQFIQFRIDPSYYFSLPHFSYHAMLKFTGIEFELIQDQDIYAWMRSAIRGGNTFVAQRHAAANLPDLPDYDPTKTLSEIRYFDTKALYSFALCQPLPVGGYKWLKPKKVRDFNFDVILKNKHRRGYMLEADLIIDNTQHEYLRDFPPLPEHRNPDRTQWSDYQWSLAKLHHAPKISPRKLIAHLGKREHYVCYGEHLLYCLGLGVKIVKIHRILTFRQSCWARPYLQYLINERSKATSNFESNSLKLMANSIYVI